MILEFWEDVELLRIKSSWSLQLGFIRLEVDLHGNILALSHKADKPNECLLSYL